MAKLSTTTNGVEKFKPLLAIPPNKTDADLATYWAQYPDAEHTDGCDYKALSRIVLVGPPSSVGGGS